MKLLGCAKFMMVAFAFQALGGAGAPIPSPHDDDGDKHPLFNSLFPDVGWLFAASAAIGGPAGLLGYSIADHAVLHDHWKKEKEDQDKSEKNSTYSPPPTTTVRPTQPIQYVQPLSIYRPAMYRGYPYPYYYPVPASPPGSAPIISPPFSPAPVTGYFQPLVPVDLPHRTIK